MCSGLPSFRTPSLPSFLPSLTCLLQWLGQHILVMYLLCIRQYTKRGGWGGELEQTSSHPLKPAVLWGKETVTDQPHHTCKTTTEMIEKRPFLNTQADVLN